jgi:dephospho-CoA kinase
MAVASPFVCLIGLTGGIGAGKSTVAQALGDRGAVIVDADRIAREVVEPDGPAFLPLVARFGDGIVGTDGRINRPVLAAMVFGSKDALADLNSITHPAIGSVMAARVAEHADSDRVVVLDIPLLREQTKSQWPFAAVIVVDTPVEVAIDRLVRSRGLDEDDARARVAAQISREERRALADVVIDNAGDHEQLRREIDRAWAFVVARCAEGAGRTT